MSEQSIGGEDPEGVNEYEGAGTGGTETGIRDGRPRGAKTRDETAPRFTEDFEVALRASQGDPVAQNEVVRRIGELPIRPMYAPLAGVCIDPDEIRSAMSQRLCASPRWLGNYRGDAPLNGYMLCGALQLQLGIRRTLERRAGILRKVVRFDPHLKARYDGIEGYADDYFRSRNDLLIRDLVYSELYEGYFQHRGPGAPVQMPTACESGFLEAVWSIAEMHVEMLGSLKSGVDARTACGNLRIVGEYADNHIAPKLIDVYVENDGATQFFVEYGVECIIDLIEAIEHRSAASSSRWTRGHRATLERLGDCRKRLGQSLWRRAA